MKRINIELDDRVVKEIDRIAGFGHRNEWIRQAIVERLKRCRK